MEDGLTTPTTISNAINSTLSGIKKISRNGSSSGGLNRTLQILSRIVTLANESDSINEEVVQPIIKIYDSFLIWEFNIILLYSNFITVIIFFKFGMVFAPLY